MALISVIGLQGVSQCLKGRMVGQRWTLLLTVFFAEVNISTEIFSVKQRSFNDGVSRDSTPLS